MTTQQKTIKGVIVFDVDRKGYRFIDYMAVEDFKNGAYMTEYSKYILVREEEIRFVLPTDFDAIGPQLSLLDDKEKELTLQYRQALHHIQVQRNNLLAIEHDASS